MRSIRNGCCWISVLVLLSGCALTGKSDGAFVPRYFTPEPLGPAAEVSGAPRVTATDLRLGRITASSDLRSNIAYRNGAHEVAYHEERLWTEHPDAYLQRALTRVLFEERKIPHAMSGAGPMLEVRLLAFEEIQSAPRGVRIRLSYTLYNERRVLAEEMLSVERPLTAGTGASDADEVAKVLGESLGVIVRQMADRIERELISVR